MKKISEAIQKSLPEIQKKLIGNRTPCTESRKSYELVLLFPGSPQWGDQRHGSPKTVREE